VQPEPELEPELELELEPEYEHIFYSKLKNIFFTVKTKTTK
jgi:hypothetical protein